ncbi:hypothetical protein PENSPDRAFT_480142 [Peniophora sp. CONT]|nr:hypothetical protein PENSPDRAFT_480142 [Peniophora sp. CONT]
MTAGRNKGRCGGTKEIRFRWWLSARGFRVDVRPTTSAALQPFALARTVRSATPTPTCRPGGIIRTSSAIRALPTLPASYRPFEARHPRSSCIRARKGHDGGVCQHASRSVHRTFRASNCMMQQMLYVIVVVFRRHGRQKRLRLRSTLSGLRTTYRRGRGGCPSSVCAIALERVVVWSKGSGHDRATSVRRCHSTRREPPRPRSESGPQPGHITSCQWLARPIREYIVHQEHTERVLDNRRH